MKREVQTAYKNRLGLTTKPSYRNIENWFFSALICEKKAPVLSEISQNSKGQMHSYQ